MRLEHVLPALRAIAPEHLAESWDKVGLQLGQPDWRVQRGLLCIDLTPAVLQEAITLRTSLIVAYHPPIFEPLTGLIDRTVPQRIVLQAACQKIAIYTPHTALDAAAGGVNDWLAEAVLPGVVKAVLPGAPKGAVAKGGSIRPIRPSAPTRDRRPYKLVTFVPPKNLDALRKALAQAGAGQIGDYSECSFTVEGEGTFLGGSSTNPTVGKRGQLEKVIERRLEMILPPENLAAVVSALHRAHPYEEPAFDLQRLELPPSSGGEAVGQGRVVQLDKPLSLSNVINRFKKHMGVKLLELAAPPGLKQIRSIGMCAGAGGSLLKEAGPIDLFVTGEMRHHDMLSAIHHNTGVLLAGHTQTERPFLPVYRERLAKELPGVEWKVSQHDRPPQKLV